MYGYNETGPVNPGTNSLGDPFRLLASRYFVPSFTVSHRSYLFHFLFVAPPHPFQPTLCVMPQAPSATRWGGGGGGCCALKTSYNISATLYSCFIHTDTDKANRILFYIIKRRRRRRRRDVVKSYYVWYLRNILERIEILFFYHFYGAMVGSRSRHSDDGRSNKSRIVKCPTRIAYSPIS